VVQQPWQPPPARARYRAVTVEVELPPPFSWRSGLALFVAIAAAALLPASLLLAHTVPTAPRLAWAIGGAVLGLLGSVAARSLAAGEAQRLWRRTRNGPATAVRARRRAERAASFSLLTRRLVTAGIPVVLLLAYR
jgi:hypothetical protein